MLFSEMPVKTFAFGCCGQLMTCKLDGDRTAQWKRRETHNLFIWLAGKEEENPWSLIKFEAMSVTMVLFCLAERERCVQPQGVRLFSPGLLILSKWYNSWLILIQIKFKVRTKSKTNISTICLPLKLIKSLRETKTEYLTTFKRPVFGI